jgi:hypothetical protein
MIKKKLIQNSHLPKLSGKLLSPLRFFDLAEYENTTETAKLSQVSHKETLGIDSYRAVDGV